MASSTISTRLENSNRYPCLGFGKSLIPAIARRPVGQLPFASQLEHARREVRQTIPVCPGVYGWFSREGSLLYVGKSKSLRHRLASYFANQTTDPKMEKIRQQSSLIVWEPISHELLALVREQELIDRLRPPLNVEGKPERRQPGFVCISRGAAPRAYFARDVSSRARSVFGPIAGRGQLSSAIVSLNYVFQLRDCAEKTRMQFSNQLRLFDDPHNAQCLRHELLSCPAPCAAGCSRESYLSNVRRAETFLRGRDFTVVNQLEAEMNKAAQRQAYERATVVRDQLSDLRWLGNRIRQLSAARRQLHGIMTLPGFDRNEVWLVLMSGVLKKCIARPQLHHQMDGTVELISRHANDKRRKIPTKSLEINLVLLLSSWLRKHPEQLRTIRSFDDTLPQMSAALKTRRICA